MRDAIEIQRMEMALGVEGFDSRNNEKGIPYVELDGWGPSDSSLREAFKEQLPDGWKDWPTSPRVAVMTCIYDAPKTVTFDGDDDEWTVAGHYELGEVECHCVHGDNSGDPKPVCELCEGDGLIYLGCETRAVLLLPPGDDRVQWDQSVCADCVLFIANGDLPEDADEYLKNVAYMEQSDGPGHWTVRASGDSEFGSTPCDCCGSSLAGDRRPALCTPVEDGVPGVVTLRAMLTELKSQIDEDTRASVDDDQPGIQVTIGWNDKDGSWSYQTGDNSFTGGAYGYPHWAVVSLYADSDVVELAKDIQNQLRDLVAS